MEALKIFCLFLVVLFGFTLLLPSKPPAIIYEKSASSQKTAVNLKFIYYKKGCFDVKLPRKYIMRCV